MKKVLSALKNVNEKVGQFFSGTALGQILSAIILAAAVAWASSIADGIKAEQAEQDFYRDISIGLSREYIQDQLGHPRNVYREIGDNLTECRYSLKHSIVTVFYDNDRLVGYFITLKDGNYKKIGTTEYSYTGGSPLGSYTFDSLLGEPAVIASSQVRREYRYIERYAPGEMEDYDLFYYMYSSNEGFEQNDPYTSEDEFRSDEKVLALDSDSLMLEPDAAEGYEMIFIDRKKACPNTFGKCIMENSKTIEDCLLHMISE